MKPSSLYNIYIYLLTSLFEKLVLVLIRPPSPVLSGQGLTQVIEKAETTLGIPSPTELSAQVEQEQKEQGEWGGGFISPSRESLLTL